MNDFVKLFEEITQKIKILFEIPESGSMTLGISKIKGFIDSAKQALDYDPSGFTSISHLENHWANHIKEIHFSFDEILNEDPKLLKFKKIGFEIKTFS